MRDKAPMNARLCPPLAHEQQDQDTYREGHEAQARHGAAPADRGDGQRRRVSLIREAGEHLLQMISDLLDLTRIESGSLQVQIEAVPLQALAQEAADMLRPQAEAAHVTLSLQIDDAGLAARADRTRLRQVLLNLLSNAVKYNRAGGRVELRVAPCAGADGRPSLSIQVSDSGVGIDAADLPHLFEPFNRLAQAHGGVEGTGIGLSVTRALVTLMHGRIDVRSTPGVVVWRRVQTRNMKLIELSPNSCNKTSA